MSRTRAEPAPSTRLLPVATCPHDVWLLHRLDLTDPSDLLGAISVVLLVDVATPRCLDAGVRSGLTVCRPGALLRGAIARHGTPGHLITPFRLEPPPGRPPVTRISARLAAALTEEMGAAIGRLWAPLRGRLLYDAVFLLHYAVKHWVATGLQEAERLDAAAPADDPPPPAAATSPVPWPATRYDARARLPPRWADAPYDAGPEIAPNSRTGRPPPRRAKA